MTDEDWGNPSARCLGLRLAGDAIDEVDDRGQRISNDTLLILLNADHEPIPFSLPAHRARIRWELVFDSQEPTGRRRQRPLRGGEVYELKPRSLVLLRLRSEQHPVDADARASRTRRGSH
jgi:isoamylase